MSLILYLLWKNSLEAVLSNQCYLDAIMCVPCLEIKSSRKALNSWSGKHSGQNTLRMKPSKIFAQDYVQKSEIFGTVHHMPKYIVMYFGIWWTVPNYQQNENWDEEIWEWVFSKIWYVQNVLQGLKSIKWWKCW